MTVACGPTEDLHNRANIPSYLLLGVSVHVRAIVCPVLQCDEHNFIEFLSTCTIPHTICVAGDACLIASRLCTISPSTFWQKEILCFVSCCSLAPALLSTKSDHSNRHGQALADPCSSSANDHRLPTPYRPRPYHHLVVYIACGVSRTTWFCASAGSLSRVLLGLQAFHAPPLRRAAFFQPP